MERTKNIETQQGDRQFHKEISFQILDNYNVVRKKQQKHQNEEEEREKEIPDGVNLVGRWHDLPNGWGVAIVEAESQEALTGWAMSWSGACTFPVITPVVDDDTGTKLLKQMQE